MFTDTYSDSEKLILFCVSILFFMVQRNALNQLEMEKVCSSCKFLGKFNMGETLKLWVSTIDKAYLDLEILLKDLKYYFSHGSMILVIYWFKGYQQTDGVTESFPCSYIEFAEHLVLP